MLQVARAQATLQSRTECKSGQQSPGLGAMKGMRGAMAGPKGMPAAAAAAAAAAGLNMSGAQAAAAAAII